MARGICSWDNAKVGKYASNTCEEMKFWEKDPASTQGDEVEKH